MSPSEIKALRKRMGLTQIQFAKEIGVCFATVNRWERGRKSPVGLSSKALNNLINKVK